MVSFSKITGRLIVAAAVVFFSLVAGAQNLNTPNKKGPLGTSVNTFSGNLFIPRNDIYIPARGFDLNVTFYYNSFDFQNNFGFGNGWSFGYDIRYRTDTLNNKIITWGDGREDTYTALQGGSYQAPKGFFSTLSEYQPNKFLLKESNGTRYYFDDNVHHKITRMEERDGNYINFSYTDSLLTSIINNAGQSLSFTYNASGRLAQVVDGIVSPARTWTYAYDGAGNLKEVKDPLNGKHTYTYLVNGPMKTMADKNNNTVDIIYYPDFTVSELIGCNKRQSYSYDTTTNITVATDYVPGGNNQVTRYGFHAVNDIGMLTSLNSNCCGYNMSFEFDDNGNKIKQTDANGNITKYTYDERGNLLTITDALNQTLTFTYSTDFNNVTSITDAKGNMSTMTYNSNGDLTQITEPGNVVYAATYNSNGNMLSSTDPKGNVYNFTYDSYGNPSVVTGPNGYQAQLGFDARGNLTSFTDARGNASGLEYDILSRLRKLTDPLTQSLQLTYDAEGNVISFTNVNNEVDHFDYDASNRVVLHTDPMNHKSNFSYDAMDNVTVTRDALNHANNYTYDSKNRLTGITDALGNKISFGYDGNGNITQVNLPNGAGYTYAYDPLNRMISVADQHGTLVRFTYDKNNNIISYTNGTGAVTTAEYDTLNRVKKMTDALGNTALFTYDKNNNVTSITDRNGLTRFYTYDGMNRVKTYTDRNGGVISVAYDNAGNAVSLKDEKNNTTTYAYDNLNRVTTTTYPDGKFIQYSYDSKGNTIAKKLTDGTSIQFTYDTLNRIISKSLPGGQVYTYGYDALGRMISATNSAGTVNLAYDAVNRLTSESFNGRITSYAYNVTGRTQTTVYPDSTVITKSFDTRNRLISIARNSQVIVSYQYNNANQVTAKTFANGVGTTLQYDQVNRLSNYSTANGTIQNTAYTYDKERRKETISRLNAPSLSEQFGYDNNYRLTSYKRGIIGGSPTVQNTYAYDPVGNRNTANLNGTGVTYASNNLNQLISSNNGSVNINFTYDNNGNLTFDGVYHKTYDAEGRLLKDSSSPVNVITYDYDAFGRRVRKALNGMPYTYTYSGASQIEERNGITGDLITRTVFNSFFTPVLNEKDNNSYYYHLNELNSVEAITNSAGSLVERYQYDAYGKQTIFDGSDAVISGSLAGNRFGFTGQEYDSATHSNRFYFRNYNPETGVFNQRDLIGYADGTGMYQYVHDNPANGIDIFGLDDCDPDPVPPPGPDKRTGWEKFKDGLNWMQWWGSNGFSNVNSITTIMQQNTVVKIIGNLTYDIHANRFNNGFVKFMNSAGMNGLLAPVNLIAAFQSAADLGANFDSRSAGQNTDAALGFVGSGVFASTSTTSLVNGIGNVVTGQGTFAEGFGSAITGTAAGTTLVATAGGLAIYGITNETTRFFTGKSIAEHGEEMEIPVYSGLIRWASGGNYYPDPPPPSRDNHWKPRIIDCPNTKAGGPRRRKHWFFLPNGDSVEVVQSFDPNEMIGPAGVPGKKWVSVNDRLPYTVLYENSDAASAPAKFVRITSPVEPKEDPSTFRLGSFGFNTLTFNVPPNTASYYQRLDARDSLGLYVDVTAGYDQINNQAFWEFQSIDPLTLLPPTDPLKGFLLLQDSSKPLNGHGFVNFSIKPVASAVTLDTIGARASIVFDMNDTIPTNIYTNTIDAFAPTSHMNALSSNSSNPIHLSWNGTDDTGGCGISYYTIYISTDQVNFRVLIPRISSTDTLISLPPDSNYCFFVLATDRVGNKETLRQGEIVCSYVGPPLPVTWLYFRGKTVAKDNILDWSTANEQNSKRFDVERSLNAVSFTKIGEVNAHGNSSQANTYQYTDYNIDRLGTEVMFYRLKQVDLDGNFKYSTIVRLRYSDRNKVNSIIYPNPTQGTATILVGDNSLIGTVAVLYDMNGRLLENIKITTNSQQIDLGKFVNGIYFIRLNNKEVLKVIKQ